MRRTLAVALAVASLAAGLAGCINAPVDPAEATGALSDVLHDLEAALKEPLTMQLSDGTALSLAVWRPDTEEKVPVIVDIGPYYRKDIVDYTAIDLRLAEYFVPRGYAVARAALRGTGGSEGCFAIGDEQEQKDVAEIVEFFGAAEWSNGNVAAFGKSYDGTTPWMAAIQKAPSLKTIVPISGISDMYRYTYYDGASYGHGPIFNTYYPLSVDYDADPIGIPPSADPTNAQQNVKPCAATESAPVVAKGYETFLTGDHDAYWDARDMEQEIPEIEVPVFLVHGLQDWNVKPDNAVPLYNAISSPKMMWLGQWEHDYPDINRFKAEWSRHDWNETLLSWFDHWLKDMDTDWESRAHVEVQDQLGTWRNYTAWPPADADRVTLYLDPSGKLVAEPGADATTRVAYSPTGFNAGDGSGGAAFVIGPFAEDVRIVGRPFADLHLALDRPGGNVAVGLYIVDADGTWTEVDRGYKELRHRASRDAGEPATPGDAFNTTVDLYPQELTIRAGESLAVSVSTEMGAWILPSPFAGVSLDLATGAGAPSAITLPFAAGHGATVLAAAGAAAGSEAGAIERALTVADVVSTDDIAAAPNH